ncbi:MAG: hypothetical protein NZ473_07010 [Candidatus Kapabacteria bacterium]|nr:hypothetical protein [Candidatus Kapabacteria bacterium]MCS7169003.1 hypothetical protein [Candidatus Kapabacteria bacterium]MDW7997258.1 hypothetical protein [Bacteroidota bacterium]MDW8224763.1 hypothetical protein [Bacteroidota bacterium]
MRWRMWMKKFPRYCLLCSTLLELQVGSTVLLPAQVTGERPEVREPVRPRLVSYIPVGRTRYYELQEHVRVQHDLPDGTVRRWERHATYLLRFYAFTSREHDMTEISCRVEDLRYRFQQDTAVLEFESRHPEKLRRRLPDLDYVSMVVGTEAEILFSSYGDIARIGGEQLEWLREHLRTETSSGSVELAAKLAAISDARLKALFDLHKGIVPGVRVREDSIWQRLLNLWIEGVEWRDTAHIHIAQTTDTTRILVGVLPALSPESQTVWPPDLPQTPVVVHSGTGHAQLTVELAPRGLISRSELHAHTEYTGLPSGAQSPFRRITQVSMIWHFVREE